MFFVRPYVEYQITKNVIWGIFQPSYLSKSMKAMAYSPPILVSFRDNVNL